MEEPKPKVSVLIPTKNSAEYLERCIQSVRAQYYANIEVIVIDNGSCDTTPQIARAKADLLVCEGSERSEQLNVGARRATGKYLYRIDGDFILDPRIVGEAVSLCESAGCDAVAVHNDSDPHAGFWARVRNFERSMYKYDATIVGARFFSKRAFDAVGGFDEALVAGEDYDIHNRLLAAGYCVGTIEPSETHLGEPRSLGEYARKCYFYGRSIGRFMQKSGGRGLRQVSPLRAAFLRHWREFIEHPLLAAGFFLMQLVKYTCGAAGLLCARISRG